LVRVQAPRVLPCWRNRNGYSLPTFVCLSVCQCLGAACGARGPARLRLRIPDGRGGQALLPGTGLTSSHAAEPGPRRIPGTVAVLPAAPAGRGLGQRRGWGPVSPCPGGLPLLCGDEVTSAPAGSDRGAGPEWRRLQGSPVPLPVPRRRAGNACGSQRDVGCPTGPDSLRSQPGTAGMAPRGGRASCR